MAYIREDLTVRRLLESRAARDPDHAYLRHAGATWTIANLNDRVNRLANGLAALGVAEGDRVPLMLQNHPDYVLASFALAKLGAVQVPMNVRLAADGLAYVLEHCEPMLVIADARFREVLAQGLAGCTARRVVWRNGQSSNREHAKQTTEADFHRVATRGSPAPPPGSPGPRDTVAILYTSGTTGPPKGVLLTDKMWRAAAYASAAVADVRDGDVMLVWEPLYHIGGVQVLVLALEHRVTLHMVDRFSATRFWDEVRDSGATQIHFLGGILQLLLRQPASDRDRDHDVRIAWGGGAPDAVWREFERRFGIEVRENYGMTEASSLTTINTDAHFGSVGRAAPYFDVRIVDTAGCEIPTGQPGEILVRELEPGLITPGYFKNPDATAAALRDGWLHTGDLGRLDESGYLYFMGRLKDSIRRRGENVSAWEIERLVDQLDWVEECAAIGVPDEIGDEDIKIFVRPSDAERVDVPALVRWCETKLGDFQVPRYYAVVDAFEKTGTQRIRKENLPRTTDDAWTRAPGGGITAPRSRIDGE